MVQKSRGGRSWGTAVLLLLLLLHTFTRFPPRVADVRIVGDHGWGEGGGRGGGADSHKIPLLLCIQTCRRDFYPRGVREFRPLPRKVRPHGRRGGGAKASSEKISVGAVLINGVLQCPSFRSGGGKSKDSRGKYFDGLSFLLRLRRDIRATCDGDRGTASAAPNRCLPLIYLPDGTNLSPTLEFTAPLDAEIRAPY